MANITDADDTHAKRVCKYFDIRNIGKYHDFYFYVQSDTLLLADIFKNFQNMYLELCEVDLARFFTAPTSA